MSLVAALALGASLPLCAGVWQSHGAGGEAAVAALTRRPRTSPRIEDGEDKPGGGATSRGSVDNANAFSHSSGNMEFKREFDFKIGNAIFRKNWVSAPSSTDASDGLGPLFNSRACQNCHLKDGRGHPPFTAGIPDDSHSMLVRLSVPPTTRCGEGQAGGPQAELDPRADLWRTAAGPLDPGSQGRGPDQDRLQEEPVTLAGGEIVSLQGARLQHRRSRLWATCRTAPCSARVAPPMIGLGLLEAMPEADILANADPDDADQDGISGKPNQVWSREDNKVMLGRFGWKASQPTINQQTAEAAAGDIGLSTAMIRQPSGDCTEKQKDCLDAPNGNSAKYGDVELSDDLFKLVTFYSHNLAVPVRRNAGDPEVLKGKALFYEIGCASCHKPKFVTGDAPGQPHLSHQLIWPYTDLLLHGMGDGLADHRPDGDASGSEGARRRCGASASPRPSTATPCFFMMAAPATSPKPFCGMAARAGGARQICQSRQRGPGASPRFRQLAVEALLPHPG